MARRPLLCMLLSLLGCECGSEALRVEGEHPYVRCLAYEIEDGALELPAGEIEDGVLTLRDVDALEFFSLRPSSVSWLEENPSEGLQVVLGGFARDAESAEALLAALAARGPALLVLGGEDDVEVFEDAHDAVDADGLVSLLGIGRVSFGEAGFVVVHGAAGGRYSRGEGACGFEASDLGALADHAQAGDLLVSGTAPSGGAFDEGLLGQHVGDADLETAATQMELGGGIYAWPRESAGFRDPEGTHFVVSSPGGFHLAADGGRFLGTPLKIKRQDGEWVAEEP